ncbi:hypothetical protein ONZ45_g9661 [Pleurotus djamor]|nr:hypothetical protein ONZ45_g9661 [Pleurotus djamor]
MKVCRFWREVALDTLELWSTIVLDSPQIAWSTKSFKRSKGAPLRLHIHYNQNMGEDNEFWALASAIMSENFRLLEVCIGWTSLFTTSNALPLLQLSDQRCAPLLENLKISIPGRHESHDPLPHLPWNNMPSLRILQLIVAKCPPLPPLPSLTRLYLGELGSHPVGCDISHFDLLRLLCGAPNLEVIEIAMPQQEVAVGQLLDFPSSTSILLASYPTDKRLSNDNVNLLGDIITRAATFVNDHTSPLGFAFSTTFSLASGIKHLELSFFNRGGYVADGAKTVATLLSANELDFPCPELEVISVNDSSSYPPSSQAADQTAPQDMFGVLVDVVKERALWTPLKIIKLHHCWVEKEVLEELERIITVEQLSLACN